MDDQESSRSNSEILEMISAADILMFMSSARASNSSPAKTIPNSNYANIRSRNMKKMKNVVTAEKVTFRPVLAAKNHHHLDVPESSTRKRKMHSSGSSVAGCSSYHVSDDFDDTFEPPTPKKIKFKRNKKSSPDSSTSTGTDKENTIIKKKPVVHGPIPPPDVPENVRSVIHEMGGTGLVLITQKILTATDVKAHNNRLQIPFSHICNPTFLTDQENNYLNGRDENNGCIPIDTLLLDPALNTHTIFLRKWSMSKNKKDSPTTTKAKISLNYVLTKHWMDVVRSNKLMEGDVIQLWGFRVGEQLYLALLKL